MNQAIDVILQQFETTTENIAKKIFSTWRNQQKVRLINFTEIMKENIKRIEKLHQEQTSTTTLWREQDIAIKKYMEWVDTLEYILPQMTSDQLWGEWRNQFEKTLLDFSEDLEIIIPHTFWKITSADPFKVRLWKSGVNVQKNILKPIDYFRKRSTSSDSIRTIQCHLFFRYYLELPLTRFFLKEWQRFLQIAVGQMYQLHQINEEIKINFVQLIDAKSPCLIPDPDKISSQLEKLNQQEKKLNPFLKRLDKFVVESIERFYQEWQTITKNIHQRSLLANTYILPQSQYNEKKIESEWRKLTTTFEQIKSNWLVHFRGEKEEWRKDLELLMLQFRVLQISTKTLESIRQKINDQIIPTFIAAKEILTISLQKFNELEQDKLRTLHTTLLNENRTLLRTLRQEKLPLMMDTLSQAQLEKYIQDYLTRIHSSLEIINNDRAVFYHRDLVNLPPQSKLHTVSCQELILAKTIPDLEKNHRVFTSQMGENIGQILRSIYEIDEIVEFNLEAALNLLRQRRHESDIYQEVHQVIKEGLSRAMALVDNLITQNQKIVEESIIFFREQSTTFGQYIQELTDETKIIQIQQRVEHSKRKKQFQDYRHQTWINIKQAVPLFLSSVARGWMVGFERLRNSIFRLKKITGLAPTSSEVEEKISQFLTETQTQISQLPYVYQRLFRTEPLKDERFFIGGDEEIEILKNDFSAWQGGQYTAAAIVGEKGSGKTTLLNFAVAKVYQKITINKIIFKETIFSEEKLLLRLKKEFNENNAVDFNDLEQKILNREMVTVCIIENIQNLFLRTVSGFDALERFLLFVSRTYQKIYWVVTCLQYSWRYLDKVINISKFFRRIIRIEGLTQQELEKMILKRNRASGYHLIFEAPKTVVKSRKYKRLKTREERQEYLKNTFFKQLNEEVATGNITVAMLFWLRSIKKNVKDRLVVSPLVDFDYSFLHQLPAQELFALAAFLQHDTLTINEFSLIFRQNMQESLLLLNRMTNRGILIYNGNEYVIHPFLYRPIVRALKVKNILH